MRTNPSLIQKRSWGIDSEKRQKEDSLADTASHVPPTSI
jgi:hypothetical protein